MISSEIPGFGIHGIQTGDRATDDLIKATI